MIEPASADTNIYGNSETISCDVFYEFDDIAINCDEAPEAQLPTNGVTPVPVTGANV